MRHGRKFNHLGRKSAHRKAMLSNMACSLIEHKRIKTTLAKAKALRVYVEPIITKSKTDTTHSRRVAFSYLKNKEAVKELFGEISDRVAERPGGYTRILKIGNRLGDNAEMAIIELVDFNELAPGKAGSGSGKKRRRRRGSGGKKKPEKTAEAASRDLEEMVEEEVIETVEEIQEDAEAVVEEVVEEVAPVEEVAEEVVEAVAEPEVVEEVVEEVAEEVVAEAPAVEEVVEEPAAEPVVADKLAKIEGIGPKIAEILTSNGIATFAQLAETEVDKLKEILEAAGARFKSHDPTTWPKQAALAAADKWDELKELQDRLDGGREVED